MIVSDAGQGRVFLINIGFGVLCVILFDMFYIFVKRYGASRRRVLLFDGVYILITFCLVLFSAVKYNMGALRYYQFLGIIAGALLWWLCFSGIERRIMEKLFILFRGTAVLMLKVLKLPILLTLRIIFTPIVYFEGKILSLFNKMIKKAKKVKIKSKNKKKTVKKRLEMI